MPTDKNLFALVYTGARPHGISIQLFRSYKCVDVTPTKPYLFTKKDNKKPEAFNYYERLASRLHIKPLVEGQEDQLPVVPDTRFIHKAPTTPFESKLNEVNEARNAGTPVTPNATVVTEPPKPEGTPTEGKETKDEVGPLLKGEHPLVPVTEELRNDIDNMFKNLAKSIDDADINMKGISDDQLVEMFEPVASPQIVKAMAKHFNITLTSSRSYPKMVREIVTNGNATLVEYINMYRNPEKVARD